MVGEGIQSVRCALTVSRTPAHASGTDTCMASGRMCGWGLTTVGGRVNECKMTANTHLPPPPPTHDMDASQRGPGEVSSHWSRTRRRTPHPCMRYRRTIMRVRKKPRDWGKRNQKEHTTVLFVCRWEGDDEHMHTPHNDAHASHPSTSTREVKWCGLPVTRWLERWMVRGWGLEVGAHAAWLLIWVSMLFLLPARGHPAKRFWPTRCWRHLVFQPDTVSVKPRLCNLTPKNKRTRFKGISTQLLVRDFPHSYELHPRCVMLLLQVPPSTHSPPPSLQQVPNRTDAHKH
jgi:hypothetical protein